MAKKPSNPSRSKPSKKAVVTHKHDDASRRNIPTAEMEPVVTPEVQTPIQVAYERRNRDLDPQLVWRGKDQQDWSDLVVSAPPLFIQEKVHPKALVDDLRRRTEAAELAGRMAGGPHATDVDGVARQKHEQIDLFADFNGLPDNDAKTEFYQHDAHWSNRMILGDSLQVMASLAEREGLRGQVQCIYFDPPYGIKFNSNFQWSTTSRDVKDGNRDHITREPEQVKAFRDTWRDGIHSYLTYLRDRFVVAHDLLRNTGAIFVQIGDQNEHRVRGVLDEVFGPDHRVGTICFQKTGSTDQQLLPQTMDFILCYSKSIDDFRHKYRQLYLGREAGTPSLDRYDQVVDQHGSMRSLTADEKLAAKLSEGLVRARLQSLASARAQGEGDLKSFAFEGRELSPGGGTFKTNATGMQRLRLAGRLRAPGRTLQYVRMLSDFDAVPLHDRWESVQLGTGLQYVVQTATRVVERCLLMASDPGDLVLDPTCGSGTTAYVAEQWGRRWITIDTSRVALALARARIMGARYPSYLKADSREGQLKEAEISGAAPSSAPTHNSLRHGFVYERVPHITLKSIANNAEIDVIWDRFQQRLEPLRAALNTALKKKWEEWEIPREADAKWPKEARDAHTRWWEQRIQRQKEIDASIAAKAEFEYLYDKPYEDKKKVRVAGPFTVESLSPHRTLHVDENDDLIDPAASRADDAGAGQDFAQMVLENLRTAGVQQAHKADRISFTSLTPWPGEYVCAEGRYVEGETEGGSGPSTGKERRAAIFIGPEFGTVARQDLVRAAREAGDAGFDVVVACAFNFEAHASEFNKLGRVPVLKARMNAELHMGSELKNTGKGNLFVIFGEPDIQILPPEGVAEDADLAGYDFIRVKINGVDVFHPQTGEVRSDGADGIACWFIDTDYNEESFFVRQAYFLGASDPYKALKTTLKAEINEEAWASLRSDTSRAFAKPKGGRIAVKVINHLGDEVMKVFRVE